MLKWLASPGGWVTKGLLVALIVGLMCVIYQFRSLVMPLTPASGHFELPLVELPTFDYVPQPSAVSPTLAAEPQFAPTPDIHATIPAATLPKGRYSLQVGYFRHRDNAERLKGDWAASVPGLRVDAVARRDDSVRYAVRFGEFVTYKEASEFAEIYNQQQPQLPALVVQAVSH